MKKLFASLKRKRHLRGLSRGRFAVESAAFLSTLNAIHPFREGNGRAQMAFFVFLAAQAGHALDLDKLEPEKFLAAMIASFKGKDGPLEQHILALTRQ
jgi:cell filamentation protein